MLLIDFTSLARAPFRRSFTGRLSCSGNDRSYHSSLAGVSSAILVGVGAIDWDSAAPVRPSEPWERSPSWWRGSTSPIAAPPAAWFLRWRWRQIGHDCGEALVLRVGKDDLVTGIDEVAAIVGLSDPRRHPTRRVSPVSVRVAPGRRQRRPRWRS